MNTPNASTVQFNPLSAQFGASRTQKRLEDHRLLTGAGRYSDDQNLPRQVWLVFVRSPHPHADIAFVDLAVARAASGVVGAWSMADLRADGVGHIPFPPLFKRSDGSPMAAPPRTPLAEGKVYYVGQPVAAVAAETREQAQDAADLVMVDYQDLPNVTDARRALEVDAPQLWPEAQGNISAVSRYGDADKTDEAFARAAHVARLSLHNQRLNAMAVEPRCSIAVYENSRWTLYTQNQTPTGVRQLLADVFGKETAAFRVVVGDIGGGFGMKAGLANEDAVLCWATRNLGRPVKWRADRGEEFLAAHMGRDQHYEAELALDKSGMILGLRVRVTANFGAMPVGTTAMIPLLLGPKVQTTVYHVPAVHFQVCGVLTNTMATGAYRGAGRPEANYMMERLIEQAAREMKLDPVEIRRRNFIASSALPYRTHLGDTYDSGEFSLVLDRVLDASDWRDFPQRKANSQQRGRLRGRGLSVYLEWTGAIPTETVDIEVAADGMVTVFSGTMAMGQGLETSYTQLVTEILGMPPEKINIVQGDTDRANGIGSVGSRSAFVGGSAVVSAGRAMIARGREFAAGALEAAAQDIEYNNGRFAIAGTDRAIDFASLAARQPEGRICVSVTETPSGPSWPNGAQVCEVEIDPDTGMVEVVTMTSVDDIGRIINHMIVEGQIHGGIAQGIGQALYESVVYDFNSGQLLTGSLMDYGVPRADQMPSLNCGFEESAPCKTNLLGVKGAGELGTIGAVPSVVHAVLDALAERGVKHIEMPCTPERVWRALQAGASKT